MANPVFVADMQTLRGKLRLSNIPDDQDAQRLVEEAMLNVRHGFYQRLGVALVNSLLATNFQPNFTTHAGSLRALANTVEVKWVRYELACIMPVLFLDGVGREQVWNEEGAFRAADIEKLREKLWNEIQEGLAILIAGGITDETGWHVTDIGPDPDTVPLPGESVAPIIGD